MVDDTPTGPKPLSSIDPEGAVIWEGPAISANKIYIVTMGPVVRITFADQARPDALPIFRTAVSLSLPDAISVAQVMSDFLKQVSAGAPQPTKGG
jgi:hypothetical protein